jgi:gluconolactonase
MKLNRSLFVGCFLCVVTVLQGQNFAGDMALSKILIKGENWERIGGNFGSTDGAATDQEGNFYFSGRRGDKGSILQVSPNGKVSTFIADAPGISGLQFGPDGKLYGTRWGKNDVVVFDQTGGFKSIATGDHPNDLVISSKGLFFFTSNAGVQFLAPSKKPVTVATGIKGPNGISLSPDQGTLIVSEYGGKHVWAYRIEVDGQLSFGEPYMTLRLPFGTEQSKGDGATTDIEGRYYVTSALGIQMFDATGRISGVISKPSSSGISNVAFAGPNHQYLYVTAGAEIYRRLTKTRGLVFSEDFRKRPLP